MKYLLKIVNILYFITWIPFFLCAYALLTDAYYADGKMFGRLFGVLAFTAYFIALLILAVSFLKKRLNKASIKKKFLIYSAPLIVLLPVVIISLLPNNLETQQHTIQVSYTAWGCDCANWSLNIDNGKAVKTDVLDKEHIFIEAANNKIELPSSIGKTGDIIQLTGQFYEKKGFPKGYSSQEFPEKARVFRYTDYKILNDHSFSILQQSFKIAIIDDISLTKSAICQ